MHRSQPSLKQFSLNTATFGHNVPGAGAGLEPKAVIDLVASKNMGGITFWRREIGDQAGLIGRACSSAGLKVTGLCRSPYLVGPERLKEDQAIIDDFRASIDMAAELGSPSLVIVTGGVEVGLRGVRSSLDRIAHFVESLIDHAEQCGVMLALEPLNPVYAADRGSLCSLRDAVDLCLRFACPSVGVALDVYHLWWDTSLVTELKRIHPGQIAGVHLCDWLYNTQDILLDRGMMGDGVADIAGITQVVRRSGYSGLFEIEVFSKNNWWLKPPEDVLDVAIERYLKLC